MPPVPCASQGGGVSGGGGLADPAGGWSAPGAGVGRLPSRLGRPRPGAAGAAAPTRTYLKYYVRPVPEREAAGHAANLPFDVRRSQLLSAAGKAAADRAAANDLAAEAAANKRPKGACAARPRSLIVLRRLSMRLKLMPR